MFKAITTTLVVLALIFSSAIFHFATLDVVTEVTITDKERITSGESSYYLVFTDREVFKNEDSTWALKFNSSDIQGSLGVGDTCTFEVTGWRMGLFSSYRNILSATCNNS